MQAAWGPIARLVVGGLLGPAGAALFRVASILSDSAGKPADLLAKAFYPEVVRMDLTSRKPWKLMLRGTVLASGLALIAILALLLGGKPIVSLLFGKAFLGAYEASPHSHGGAVPQRLQLPTSPDALRARPARRPAQGTAVRKHSLFPR